LSYDIVGCGAVVEIYHHAPVINVLRDQCGLTIAGCYDPDKDQARRVALQVGAERHGPRAQPRRGDGVNGALLTTPPNLHAQIAGEYVDAGKGVFVEKPLTGASSDARQLVERSAQTGARVLVNQTWRFFPSVNIARAWLHGRLDEVHSIEATEGNRLDWPLTSNYIVEDPYGGVIHDTGAHLVDMVLYLLRLDEVAIGASAEVGEVAKTPAREPSHECRVSLVLHDGADRSVPVELMLSRLRPLARAVKVRGSFGTLVVPTAFARAPILFNGAQAFKIRAAELAPEPFDFRGCFLLAHRDFVTALTEPDRPTKLDAQRFLLLMEILSLLRGWDEP
jgi:predicted dehydrogenase